MSSQRERMLSGALYKADDDDLAASRRACQRVLDKFNATRADDDNVRQALLRELVGSLGTSSVILPRFQCDYGRNIAIGAHTFINYDSVMLDCAPITIGDYVSIGPRAQLLTAWHPVDEHEARREGWEAASPIMISDNTWIGGGVILCPGVSVGHNAVIGAGSVVTKDIPAHVVAAGNPCRVIRELS
jgi:maltose O-acetyltransferase